MRFDRIDICEAYYLYASLHHRGMGSAEYAVFGRLNAINFIPRPMLQVQTLTDNGRAVYDRLVKEGL